jgi:hypothetical protein
MSDRYSRLKAQRQEDRRVKLLAQTTARIGRLALAIYELDHQAGRPPSADVVAALHEVSRITGIKP